MQAVVQALVEKGLIKNTIKRVLYILIFTY